MSLLNELILKALFADLGKPFHLVPVMVALCEEYIQRFNTNKLHDCDKLVIEV